jgi:pimeloyl-ACP methyl ester carboxylesterase
MEGYDPNDIKYNYETLWKFIIRPPRDIYDEELFGEPIFEYNNKIIVRHDFNLQSSQGYNLKCSFFEPDIESRPSPIMPVVIYLHGNSSSRLEGFRMLHQLIKINVNLFIFDFAGSGLSEGDYISLGYHESHDLGIIIDFISKYPGVGKIGLWGRSMGAATTMIYAHKDEERVKCIVMDSPFADFSKLAKELVKKQINIPNFLIDGALKIVGSTIKSKNGMEINKLKPIDCASKTNVPALFIHAINDELINIQHTKDLIAKYKGKYFLEQVPNGGHNSVRPKSIIKKIRNFFVKYLIENNNNNDDNKINENSLGLFDNNINDKSNEYITDNKKEEMQMNSMNSIFKNLNENFINNIEKLNENQEFNFNDENNNIKNNKTNKNNKKNKDNEFYKEINSINFDYDLFYNDYNNSNDNINFNINDKNVNNENK